MATIIEAHVTSVTEDVTGQVADGYIRLRAPLFPVDVDTPMHSYYSDLSWDWGQLESLEKTIPDVWLQPAVERQQFMPLLMASLHSSHSFQIFGLVLDPVDGKQGVYRRWGIISLYENLAGEFSNFGVRLIKGQRTYRYDPPEMYPEQVLTLI